MRSSALSKGLSVEISPGELIDKITILEIKREHMTDAAKLENIEREWTMLTAARDGAVKPSTELDRLAAELKRVNERLWEIEDDIRDCERRKDFGKRFVELARGVYKNNDRRSEIKRAINQLLGSRLTEEKSYAAY
ncbi:MAG: DUF6165 family protein [Rhodospirillales bacterium]